MAFKVTMEPKGDNPGVLKRAVDKLGLGSSEPNDNTGGIVIYVENSEGVKEEVSRVAYIRRVSRNPTVEFPVQLRKEREKAEAAVAELNQLTAGQGELA